MKIFFSVGEPSGDLHGANLIREFRKLRPDIECTGFGGPVMQEAGCKLNYELTALAVMFIARVLANLLTFFKILRMADRACLIDRPDAVVLIDYPGFNWWVARRAKRHGIPVYYFSPPQVWAWASWRVKKMRRFVDHVLSGLPFETEWLQRQGVHATFVGHPYFDEVRRQKLDGAFVERLRAQGPLLAILPGSRTQEVEHNLPQMLQAVALVKNRAPHTNFAVAAFRPKHAQMACEMIEASGLDVQVYLGKTPELIHLADCCVATSGSVSLELLYQKKPTVIVYKIGRLGFAIQRLLCRVRYITLVNLLTAKEVFLRPGEQSGVWGAQQGPPRAGDPPRDKPPEKALFPEYLSCEDRAPQIAGHLIRWMLVEEYRDSAAAELAKLKARIAHGGASRNAAQIILNELGARKMLPLKPHYTPSESAHTKAA